MATQTTQSIEPGEIDLEYQDKTKRKYISSVSEHELSLSESKAESKKQAKKKAKHEKQKAEGTKDTENMNIVDISKQLREINVMLSKASNSNKLIFMQANTYTVEPNSFQLNPLEEKRHSESFSTKTGTEASTGSFIRSILIGLVYHGHRHNIYKRFYFGKYTIINCCPLSWCNEDEGLVVFQGISGYSDTP
ncbi:hypothetical protein DPMN_136404 [Dreissena polymorpha]|uniref:Uncharacterized protein n=1 Tax=Dreissena polymorpha TaxID=45954 RepID=A0A9D4JDR4_DREPO|nr:hypothetical protein DPMN_136404 [Dreissena polymorpha]